MLISRFHQHCTGKSSLKISTWVSTNTKKDQSAECEKYDLMSATEKEQCRTPIEQHQARNKETQTDKATDKQRAKDDSVSVNQL